MHYPLLMHVLNPFRNLLKYFSYFVLSQIITSSVHELCEVHLVHVSNNCECLMRCMDALDWQDTRVIQLKHNISLSKSILHDDSSTALGRHDFEGLKHSCLSIFTYLHDRICTHSKSVSALESFFERDRLTLQMGTESR